MFSNSKFENIEIIEKIQIGRHGIVSIGKRILPESRLSTTEMLAIKQIRIGWPTVYQGLDRMTFNEISALIALKDYKEFVQLLAISINKRTIQLLFPAATCNLSTYLKKLTFIERMSDIDCFINTCLNALTILYNNRIFHGDLKPDNILVYETETSKEFRVCDFSLAAYVFPGSICDEREYITYTYRPPELLLESIDPLFSREKDSTTGEEKRVRHRIRICNLIRCDAWSIGIIILQFYIGFSRILRFRDPVKLYDWIMSTTFEGSLDIREILGTEVDKDYQPFIEETHILLVESLLKIDPRKRWRPFRFAPLSTIFVTGSKNYYNSTLQQKIFDLCDSANLVFTIALTTLDILTRYIRTEPRNIHGREYEEINLDAVEIIAVLKMTYEFYEDVCDTLFICIKFYSQFILGEGATEEKIREDSVNYEIETICSKEIEIMKRLDGYLMPNYLINLIATCRLMDYDYDISNKLLNNIYSIS
ncbi:MAG: hypothetical protein Solivirus3_17 [Solivirus sp.]|uniref:Protein kinase domain-containing protein n=1 Tax=Solivirus sp. TaxID=2487772 RepID=A0A3G5AFR3_9VIRU|nr:MAG: hypothetical protein Solivirus3_17 [Solivirus sp.]